MEEPADKKAISRTQKKPKTLPDNQGTKWDEEMGIRFIKGTARGLINRKSFMVPTCVQQECDQLNSAMEL